MRRFAIAFKSRRGRPRLDLDSACFTGPTMLMRPVSHQTPHSGSPHPQSVSRSSFRSREQYLKFNREGRGLGLKETQRAVIWDVYEAAEASRMAEGLFDWDDLPNMAMAFLDRLPSPPQFRAVIVDEAQDCTPVMMRLARRLLADSNGPLTVFADPAQAIYQHGFQWTQRELKPSGGNVRWLRKNYRCTREIYDLARPLLEDEPGLAKGLAQNPATRPPRSRANPGHVARPRRAPRQHHSPRSTRPCGPPRQPGCRFSPRTLPSAT
jgi:superfamily I DNA/RNA helicase